MRLTRIVRTGLSITVSTPAIAAAWTTCVAPRTTSVRNGRVEHVALHEREVRMLGERGAAERVAVEVVDGDDLVLVDEPPRECRPDEARAARDHDALSRQSHAGESSDLRVFIPPLQGGSTLAAMRAVLALLAVCVGLVACSAAVRWSLERNVASHRVLGRRDRSEARCRVDASVRTRRRVARTAGARVRPTRGRREGVVRPALAEGRVHARSTAGRRRARVTGVLDGRRVWATFTRSNGCQIARWAKVSPWLLPPGGVT